VKWQGYDDEEDHTEEPEDNLENAQELVEAYWVTQGGRPDGAKSKKRKHSNVAEDTPKNGRGRKRAKESEDEDLPKKKKERKYPDGSWEHHIACVDTLEEKWNPKTGEMDKKAFVSWNDGYEPPKSSHDLETIRKKAPHKVLTWVLDVNT
jgi:chromobox protein 1